MPIWELVVDLVRESLFVLANVFGGSMGLAIAALSVGVRAALVPLGVRFAIRMREHQARLQAIQPRLRRLQTRYATNRRELDRRVRDLLAREGISLFPKGMALAVGVQLPIGAALYQAIASGLAPGAHFLWIADLARPDVALAMIAAAFGGIVSLVAPSQHGTLSPPQLIAVVVSGAITFAIVWRVAAGVGIYWAASNLVAIVQGFIVRRVVRSSAAT